MRELSKIHLVGRTRNLKGKGMGSVLLQKGGVGSASSYSSVDEYEKTTGVDVKGSGLDRLNDKLGSLIIKEKVRKQKPKNINFNL